MNNLPISTKSLLFRRIKLDKYKLAMLKYLYNRD